MFKHKMFYKPGDMVPCVKCGFWNAQLVWAITPMHLGPGDHLEIDVEKPLDDRVRAVLNSAGRVLWTAEIDELETDTPECRKLIEELVNE